MKTPGAGERVCVSERLLVASGGPWYALAPVYSGLAGGDEGLTPLESGVGVVYYCRTQARQDVAGDDGGNRSRGGRCETGIGW